MKRMIATITGVVAVTLAVTAGVACSRGDVTSVVPIRTINGPFCPEFVPNLVPFDQVLAFFEGEFRRV